MHTHLVILLLVGFLFVSLSLQQSGPKAPTSFSALLDRKEQIARMVCSNLTSYFDNLAINLPNFFDRESCFYYDGCDKNLEYKMPKYGCALGFNYGNPEKKCSSCSARSVSFEYSVTLFPTGDDGVQKYTPRTAVSVAKVRDLRCALQDLRFTYRDAKYKVDDTISQIYVAGEYAPMINTYPGLNWRFNNSQASSVCLENDAFTTASSCYSGFEYRNRPWFVSASYVSKNIFLIIDYSSVVMRSSSGGYSRTVSAINSLLNSLNERDKIAAVLFSKKAIIYPGNENTGFLFANDATKSSLLAWILSLFAETSTTTNSGSYHTAAFETSFGFLKQYSSSLTSCDTSLVVFGDADNIKDESNPVNSLLSQYQSLSNQFGSNFVKKVRVFSFSVGIQKGQANPLKSYPCLTGGLWIPLDPSDATTEQASDVRGLMSPFFSFHSYRRLGKNETIWSDFYSDLLGIGNMTTAALPCYSSSGTFLGVVGVDVPSTLFNTTTYPDANSEFATRKALSDGVGYCPDAEIKQSFIDDLRGGACNYCNQPCGNLAVMLGFIPAVLVAFVVFVIVSFYFYKRSLMKAEGDDEKEDKALVK